MTWADVPRNHHFETMEGGVILASESTLGPLASSAEDEGFLWVELSPPGPAQRGRLALYIEDAVEQALTARGAAPRGVAASSSLDAAIGDQLYRARLVEFRGIALGIPNLAGIAGIALSLDADDSAVLRWWLRATEERPLRVLIDDSNRRLQVYTAPVPFSQLFEAMLPRVNRAEVSEDVDAVDAKEVTDDGDEFDVGVPAKEADAVDVRAATEDGAAEDGAAVDAAGQVEQVVDGDIAEATEDAEAVDVKAPTEDTASVDDVAEPLEDAASLDAPGQVEQVVDDLAEASEARAALDTGPIGSVVDGDVTGATEDAIEVAEPIEHAAVVAQPFETQPQNDNLGAVVAPLGNPEAAASTPLADQGAAPAETDAEAAAPAETEAEAHPTASEADAAPSEAVAPSRPLLPRTQPLPMPSPSNRDAAETFEHKASNEWRRWASDLQTTRGPKPLSVIERTFISAYIPLSEALSRGLAEPEAAQVLQGWARTFEQSYSEAFDALRVRGKRPTMVLDIPDVALRIGRLHGARSVQLVLVDGMRFDLGLRVQEQLSEQLAGRASLSERLLVWSALPSTTAVQVELLGKGPEGLRNPSAASDSEPVVARGRAASSLRRIKAGRRELFKLDVIEAAFAEPGGSLPERLDAVAAETADALALHLERQAPRTLVMIFGDHGFTLDLRDGGTSAAKQGGAKPEQVLVPAMGWLVGSVH